MYPSRCSTLLRSAPHRSATSTLGNSHRPNGEQTLRRGRSLPMRPSSSSSSHWASSESLPNENACRANFVSQIANRFRQARQRICDLQLQHRSRAGSGISTAARPAPGSFQARSARGRGRAAPAALEAERVPGGDSQSGELSFVRRGLGTSLISVSVRFFASIDPSSLEGTTRTPSSATRRSSAFALPRSSSLLCVVASPFSRRGG